MNETVSFWTGVQWVKKRANFKTNKILQAIQLFLHCLYSNKGGHFHFHVFIWIDAINELSKKSYTALQRPCGERPIRSYRSEAKKTEGT